LVLVCRRWKATLDETFTSGTPSTGSTQAKLSLGPWYWIWMMPVTERSSCWMKMMRSAAWLIGCSAEQKNPPHALAGVGTVVAARVPVRPTARVAAFRRSTMLQRLVLFMERRFMSGLLRVLPASSAPTLCTGWTR
jgi:hypothetical protein